MRRHIPKRIERLELQAGTTAECFLRFADPETVNHARSGNAHGNADLANKERNLLAYDRNSKWKIAATVRDVLMQDDIFKAFGRGRKK